MTTFRFEDMPIQLHRRSREVGRSMTDIVRAAATAIDNGVVDATPVDKGVARSNWVGTVDTPFFGILPAYTPYPPARAPRGVGAGRRGETANAAAAKIQAQTAIRRFDTRRHRSIFITNNTPYINKLNASVPPWSNQSPSFFIETAFMAAIAKQGLIRKKVLKR